MISYFRRNGQLIWFLIYLKIIDNFQEHLRQAIARAAAKREDGFPSSGLYCLQLDDATLTPMVTPGDPRKPYIMEQKVFLWLLYMFTVCVNLFHDATLMPMVTPGNPCKPFIMEQNIVIWLLYLVALCIFQAINIHAPNKILEKSLNLILSNFCINIIRFYSYHKLNKASQRKIEMNSL